MTASIRLYFSTSDQQSVSYLRGAVPGLRHDFQLPDCIIVRGSNKPNVGAAFPLLQYLPVSFIARSISETVLLPSFPSPNITTSVRFVILTSTSLRIVVLRT